MNNTVTCARGVARLLVASDGTVLSPRPPAQGEPRDGAGESDDGVVTLRQFMRFWKLEMEPYDHQARFFRLVKKPWAECVRAAGARSAGGVTPPLPSRAQLHCAA